MADVTAEDLKAAGLADEPKFVCPECGAEYNSVGGLGSHRFARHGVRGTKRADKRTRSEPQRVSLAETTIKKEIDKAVGNLIVVGGYVAIVLPHTGIAIAGDPGGNGRLPVQSRAAVAGEILAEYAKRDARVLEAIVRFNQFFEGSAAAKLAIDMAAVVAVDVGVIDPHMEVEVGPFRQDTAFGPLKPVEMVVGDVVAAVDNLRAQYSPQSSSVVLEPEAPTNGSTPRRSRKKSDTVVVEGGVEST